jgi:hypothetical protein
MVGHCCNRFAGWPTMGRPYVLRIGTAPASSPSV